MSIEIRPSSARPRARAAPDGWLWRRYARVYDALEGLAGYREMVDALVVAVGPVQGRVVTEIGCGTGNVLTRLLADSPARLIGIDSSRAMLRRARAKTHPAVRTGQVQLWCTDAVTGLAELATASVDVLVASNVLYALPDRAAFWREAARVLTPHGRVVLSNPDRSGFGPAVRQQWQSSGLSGFTDPRLVEVLMINVAIDLLAAARKYDFAPWSQLTDEAAAAGLPGAVLHGRCYGGPVDGMNVVGTLYRTTAGTAPRE